MKQHIKVSVIGSVLALLSIILMPWSAGATHSWGGYHWARTSNPFTLTLGDNVSGSWDAALQTASSDWSQSSVLDTVITQGSTNPKNCRPKAGRIEVCNAKYGNNGWLGLASVWVSGTHITQATAKMNDTYFNTPTYNTVAWKNLVMCQEIAHGFGLDHQDETFTNANLGSCMDYTNNPLANQHPNQHDFEMLEDIYAHLDTTTTVGQTVNGAQSQTPAMLDVEAQEWGQAIRTNEAGKPSLFVKNLGKDKQLFTFVFWVDPEHHVHE